jgi:hypothetical protein
MEVFDRWGHLSMGDGGRADARQLLEVDLLPVQAVLEQLWHQTSRYVDPDRRL